MKQRWPLILVACLALAALVGVGVHSNREMVQLKQQLKKTEQRLYQVEAKLQLRTQLLGMAR